MAFKSSYDSQPCRLPKLNAGGVLVGVHNYKWPSVPPTTCSRAGYPSWTLEEHQLGVTTRNGLQTPPTTCNHTDYLSWTLAVRQLGSRLQMAFRSSNHLQPCQLSKPDAGGVSIWVHDYKWPSNSSYH